MDPVSLGVAGVGASELGTGSIIGSIAGTGLKVFGDLFGASSKKDMYNYQAGVARMRANIDRQNSTWARDAGDQQAMLQGFKTGQEIGGVVAKQGASGVQVGTGSNADVIDAIRTSGAYDQGMIRYNAAKKAYGFEVQASGEEASAKLAETAGKNAMLEGWLGAGSSLIGGATSVADKWLKGRQVGLWDDNPRDVGSATVMEG